MKREGRLERAPSRTSEEGELCFQLETRRWASQEFEQREGQVGGWPRGETTARLQDSSANRQQAPTVCRLWLRVPGELRFRPCPCGRTGGVGGVSEGHTGGASLCSPTQSMDSGCWNGMAQGTGTPGISWPRSQGQVRLLSPLAKPSPSPRDGSEPGERPSLKHRLLPPAHAAAPTCPAVTSKENVRSSGTSPMSLPATGPEMLLPSFNPTPQALRCHCWGPPGSSTKAPPGPWGLATKPTDLVPPCFPPSSAPSLPVCPFTGPQTPTSQGREWG